jgi:hypothetical protein
VLGQTLEELALELEDPEHAPLVVMAHSLGCTIVSNYLWDAQHRRYARGAEGGFARGRTLAGLITFGCNLPLFTLAHEPADIQPIQFPGPGARACFPGRTEEELRSACRWLNFYDPDDILGYPLRPINRAYAETVSADLAIDTGTLFGAHSDYWTDNDFTRPVARYLVELARFQESRPVVGPAG